MNSYVELNPNSDLDIPNVNNIAQSEQNAFVDKTGFPTDTPISHAYMYVHIDMNYTLLNSVYPIHETPSMFCEAV